MLRLSMEDFIIAMPEKKSKQNKNKQTKNKSEKSRKGFEPITLLAAV